MKPRSRISPAGDTVTARFLRREFFDFRPIFKLWLRGNHKPRYAARTRVFGAASTLSRSRCRSRRTSKIPHYSRSSKPSCLESSTGLFKVAWSGSVKAYYSRMETVLQVRRDMNPPDWLQLVGDMWSSCDNLSLYFDPLRASLPRRGPVVAMMTCPERDALSALPEQFAIYRGAGEINLEGASWSLKREVAARFPNLYRYRPQGPAFLVTAKVSKSRVLALRLDRQESEIITFAPTILGIEPLALSSRSSLPILR
jgi:hypothetical protein